jgi:glycosyltransferase involved in cell wall biosynthesis
VKILFISTLSHINWGGSEELWSHAADQFIEMGHQVTCITFTQGTSVEIQRLRQAGANSIKITKPGFVKRIVRNKTGFEVTRHYLNLIDPDLVIISFSSHFLGLEWMEELTKRGTPFVNLFQLVSDEYKIDPRKEMERWRVCLKDAALNCFVSKQNHKLMERNLASTISNVKIVWNPFKGSWEQPFVYPGETTGLRLACIAGYVPGHKGQDILFEVFSDKKWKERDLEISLYGQGIYRQYLEDLLVHYSTRNISIHDHQPVENIWTNHHGLILPSRKEGMSLALIEAMMTGRFAVTTNVGGAKEIIDDGISGFIASAPFAEFVDEALERAWRRKSEWKDISQSAYFNIRTKIPRDPVADFVSNVLHSI